MSNNINLNDSKYFQEYNNPKYPNINNCPTASCMCYKPCNLPNPSIYKPSIEYQVSIPINLAKSLEGKYFVGYADNLSFG
ncbi:hypothetical protein [Tissierella praeacuta]|nr:hypothetical protein [Tissierella praeacuta]